MKLLLPVAVYAGVAASQIQIPLITDAAFKAWMPPAGALSDREFQHRCGTVMSVANPLYLTEECQGTAEWCLGQLYPRDEFASPEACLASRRRKPWREPAGPQSGRRCLKKSRAAEDCVGTERWCREGLWRGSGELFGGPPPCLASREPKPKASVERRQVVAREPEPEFVPLRNGGSRKRWNAFEGHEA